MFKKLLSFFVLTLCIVGNVSASVSVPEKLWKSGRAVGGGTFYFYNIGANRYLNNGSTWDTHAILDGAGRQVQIDAWGDGGSLYVNDGYLFLNNQGQVYTDGKENENHRIAFQCNAVSVNGYTNAYTLSCMYNGERVYLGWAGGSGIYGNEVIQTNSQPSSENFYWLLISPDDRKFDLTYYIQNPDFERWGQSQFKPKTGDPTKTEQDIKGWNNGGFWRNSTEQQDIYAKSLFTEKWTGSAPLAPDNLSQTVNLPQGVYTLTVNAKATGNQSGSGTGVKLYLGGSETDIGSEGFYQVTTTHSGGDLNLGIRILEGNNVNWVRFDNIRLFNAISFSENLVKTRLIDLEVNEPTLNLPSGATVISYSSSNEKIAKVGNNGNVMVVNTGLTTITATVQYNGQTYTPSYNLIVEAGAATYVIDGNEFRFEYVYSDGDDDIVPHPDGSGKLLDRVVTGVEHITMEFGNVYESNAYNRNQTIVRNEQNIGLVATTLDANGWRHLWWNTDNGHTVPYQGTFYTFKPDANGTLTIRGYLGGAGQTAHIVDASNNYSKAKNLSGQDVDITASSATDLIETTVKLEAGHTYYLYGDIRKNNGDHTEYCTATSEIWGIYQLKSFVFTSGFRYAHKSVILPKGQTEYLQQLATTGATYSIQCSGDVTADIDASNGRIYNISKKADSDVLGGAIAVTATKDGVSTYYVLTIPYLLDNDHQTKTWTFDGVDLEIKNSNALSMYYKVRQYDDYKNMTECKKPVISNDLSLDGDNAYYFGATAGLIVEANSKSFGANATVVDLLAGATADLLADVTWVDQQLKTMLNYEYPSANVSNPAQITMNKNVTLKIPGLKAGQHVQIKWDHHLNGKLGDSFTVTNAKDLDGTVIPSDAVLKVGVTHVLNSANEMKVYGSEEFIVAEDDKDFEFHITDEGWVNIYEITISYVDEDIPSDIILYTDVTGSHFDCTGGRAVIHNGSGTTFYFTGVTHHGGSRVAFGLGMNYEIAQTVGTVNSSINANDGTLSINSGRGILKIVTRAKTNGFTVDKREDWVPVIIEGQSTHTYPYTWDFQNMYSYIDNEQMDLCAGENVFWKKVGDAYTYQTKAAEEYGSVTLATPERPMGFHNTQLYAHDAVIPDAAGLYFQNNDLGRNNNFIEINKNGLKVCAARNHKVVIPNVGSDQYVYIRVAGTEGAIADRAGAKNDDPINYEPYKIIDGDNVYRFQGTGGDLTVWMGGVTIKQIGVTGITKTLFDGYATESRDIAIDHSLTDVFTGDGVIAQYVKKASYNRNSATVTLSDVPTTTTTNDGAIHQVVPANTGVVLKCTDKVNEASYPGVPFFVPAMRTSSSSISDNMLAASVTSTELSETMKVNGTDYTPFIFTKKYCTYTVTNGVGVWGPEQTAAEYGYYRLAANYGSTISANKSYLLVPGLDAALWAQSGNVKGVTILNLDDSAVGIESVASPIEPGVFYNMSGSKVTTPTQPGVYIYNGKKIMVK